MGNEPLSVPPLDATPLNIENAVTERYSSASRSTEPSLCCPVDYNLKYLEVLPQELIDRDYGCGDPSRWLEEGDDVLDLGSGGGKICYIASQIVGESGRVWGVDMNDDMLALAERHRKQIGDRIGYHNVSFFKGRIQDLALDLRKLEQLFSKRPIQTAQDWLSAQQLVSELRSAQPMIPDESIDVVMSNCVLNLVPPDARKQLFEETYRVLRPGGRAVISDIVCDEPVPERMRQDPGLWSGCISGAFVEGDFLDAFSDAGFYGIQLVDRPEAPWATVEGIEFRSVTIRAFKGKEGPCLDHRQAVIYQGPWKQVVDDDGHTLRRGVPMAVCAKTFNIYTRQPYCDQIMAVPPRHPVASEDAEPFDCRRDLQRHPRETKGDDFDETRLPDNSCCGPEGC